MYAKLFSPSREGEPVFDPDSELFEEEGEETFVPIGSGRRGWGETPFGTYFFAFALFATMYFFSSLASAF